MWHEEAEEPEDNVLALTLSFLTAAHQQIHVRAESVMKVICLQPT